MGLNERLLYEFVSKRSPPNEIHQLPCDLTKGIVERALEGEMKTHLG